MTASRTQIYFSEAQRKRIDRAAAARGVAMAEIVREAVDEYLKDDVDPSDALASTFGAMREAAFPSRNDWRRG